jgi:hypothetical protein
MAYFVIFVSFPNRFAVVFEMLILSLSSFPASLFLFSFAIQPLLLQVELIVDSHSMESEGCATKGV